MANSNDLEKYLKKHNGYIDIRNEEKTKNIIKALIEINIEPSLKDIEIKKCSSLLVNDHDKRIIIFYCSMFTSNSVDYPMIKPNDPIIQPLNPVAKIIDFEKFPNITWERVVELIYEKLNDDTISNNEEDNTTIAVIDEEKYNNDSTLNNTDRRLQNIYYKLENVRNNISTFGAFNLKLLAIEEDDSISLSKFTIIMEALSNLNQELYIVSTLIKDEDPLYNLIINYLERYEFFSRYIVNESKGINKLIINYLHDQLSFTNGTTKLLYDYFENKYYKNSNDSF